MVLKPLALVCGKISEDFTDADQKTARLLVAENNAESAGNAEDQNPDRTVNSKGCIQKQ